MAYKAKKKNGATSSIIIAHHIISIYPLKISMRRNQHQRHRNNINLAYRVNIIRGAHISWRCSAYALSKRHHQRAKRINALAISARRRVAHESVAASSNARGGSIAARRRSGSKPSTSAAYHQRGSSSEGGKIISNARIDKRRSGAHQASRVAASYSASGANSA